MATTKHRNCGRGRNFGLPAVPAPGALFALTPQGGVIESGQHGAAVASASPPASSLVALRQNRPTIDQRQCTWHVGRFAVRAVTEFSVGRYNELVGVLLSGCYEMPEVR